MRKRLIIFYLTVVAFLCIYLPWKIEYQGNRASVGYFFIWSPEDMSFSVDFGRLLLEIVTVTLLAAVAYIVFGNSEKQADEIVIGKTDIREIRKVRRRPMIALLLSFLAPGLGQVYNGQLKKGLIFYSAIFILSILMAMAGLQLYFKSMVVFMALLICYALFTIGDAAIVSYKLKEIALRPYNRWYVYFFLATLAIGINSKIGKPLV